MQGQRVCRVKEEVFYHNTWEEVCRVDWVGETREKEPIKRVNRPHANCFFVVAGKNGYASVSLSVFCRVSL